MNKNVLKYAAITVAMACAAPVMAEAIRWSTTGRPPRALRPVIDRFNGQDTPEPMPAVLHELELARLAEEVQRVRAGNQPGQMFRVRATTAAYDGVLLESCRTLGIAAPTSRVPLSDDERFEVESRLLHAGMRW